VLRANPDYFGPPPGSERLVVTWISDPAALLLQARTGRADVTLGLGKQQVHSLATNPAVRIIANDTTLVEQVHLPNTKEPWTNRLVREALTYAVPYEDILARVAFGYGSLFYGPLSPGFPQFNPELSAPRPFDLDRARRLLAESGISLPFDVEMTIAEGNIIHQQIATILQGVWRQLNVNMTIRVVSAAEFADLTQGHRTQAHIRLDGPGVIDAGYFLAYDMICDIGFNLAEVCIPEADALLWEARSTVDPVAQQALYDRITELWIADSPKIMVYADQFTAVLSAAVTDYHFSHLVDMRRWAK
jgi:peptide/nickel transport system substrate-binding protein